MEIIGEAFSGASLNMPEFFLQKQSHVNWIIDTFNLPVR